MELARRVMLYRTVATDGCYEVHAQLIVPESGFLRESWLVHSDS